MLERLKEYKELIAIIAFFLGGFFWLQSQYPSKNDVKDEFNSIRCQLNSYMKLTQLQILNQELEKQLNALKLQLASVNLAEAGGSASAISPAMKLEIDQMKSDFSSVRNQLGQTTGEMKKIRDTLELGSCGKAGL
ncbi:hypothetical protein [Gallionella capsiferriformans]|uniref:Uncharacterized protein n=1 Tax=Gallionella capsiferriformans (strain ES-2) TaxID=395494 RepID=D9SJT1_GALCS|nr:hypothetical protein [Gallionella capsiferriformans]ADL54430.1 hypothetical protein Galf_0386 [Gallionella capsiferriformans ES-2]